MRYGHPQQTQIVGRIPIGVGTEGASLTGEVLAPARTKTAAARATLARIVRLHDLDGNAGDVGLVVDECPKLNKTPARGVPAAGLRTIVRPRMPVKSSRQIPARISIASWTMRLLMAWFFAVWKHLS
jgi:hypothetical protein